MRFKGLLSAFVTAGALICGLPAAADVGSGSGPPTAIGTGGAAASVEKLATEAAVGILRRGGNAVDAAVASAKAAFPGWRATSLSRRTEILFRIRNLVEQRRHEIASGSRPDAFP